MSEREILALPCPFCGGRPVIDVQHENAVCRRCNATGPMAHSLTDAIAAWNAAPRLGTCAEVPQVRNGEGHDHAEYIDGCRVQFSSGVSDYPPEQVWGTPEYIAHGKRLRALADDNAEHGIRHKLREIAEELENKPADGQGRQDGP